jgi:hypothetical protein
MGLTTEPAIGEEGEEEYGEVDRGMKDARTRETT